MARKPRPNPLTVRLPPNERAEIEARAARAGLSIGGYFRAAVLEVPMLRVIRRLFVDWQELARLLGAIGHINSNINQLARTANSKN